MTERQPQARHWPQTVANVTAYSEVSAENPTDGEPNTDDEDSSVAIVNAKGA